MRALLKTPQGFIGIVLITIFWPFNWFLPGVRTAYCFFPLWLGYILTIDAVVLKRSGSSMLTRSRRDWLWLFIISAPAWWLFEAINRRTGNWEYLGAEQFGNIEYFLLSTLSFSTVMPAVFETAEWVRTFPWTERFRASGPPRFTPENWKYILAGGLFSLALVLVWPVVFYPLVWLSVFFIIEPLNYRLGRPHLLECLAIGDWRPVVSLSLGALICGFFWEMWNYYSYPKWIYHTPGVEYLHVFEMPILGYLGYIPFAWELHALRSFLWPAAQRLRI